MSIEKDKHDKSLWPEGFQMRDETPARIYAIDGCDGRIHGAYLASGGWHSRTWHGNGRYSTCGIHPLDLVRRPVKHRKVLNLCEDGRCFAYDNRALADRNAHSDRIACIEIEFTEGEGLK